MRLRLAARVFLLVPAVYAGAQGMPVTAPTLAPAAPAPASALVAAPARPQLPEHRARVQFAGHTLQVTADNSSLNQILREIQRVTGLKISGGVTDERVYGSYGPAETSAVLSALLGGTGSNMLLIVDRHNMPTELILTPRQGGPTPPSPNTGRDEREDRDENPDTPPQLSQRVQREPTPPPQQPPVEAPPTAPPPAAVQADQPAAATTTDQSPNGVKTPQQIYEQLLKLQQQQPKTPAASNPQ